MRRKLIKERKENVSRKIKKDKTSKKNEVTIEKKEGNIIQLSSNKRNIVEKEFQSKEGM